MAGKDIHEKQMLLQLVEKIPFTDEDKKAWLENLQENDLTEDLLEEVHTKLKEIPADKFPNDWLKMKYSTDLARIIKQWRMSLASKHFKHGH